MKPQARRTRLVVVAAAVALTTVAVTSTNLASAAVRSPTFTTPLQLTASFPYGLTQGEPTIKSNAAGSLFVMAPGSTPIGCELWKLPPGAATSAFLGAPDGGAGGGDCDLAFSPDTPPGQSAQTLAYSSLTLPDITVGSSTDNGSTFSPPNPAGSPVVGDDRQWLAAAAGNTFYMSSHIVASDNIAVSKSTDGGRSYSFVGLAIDAAHLAQAAYNNELGPLVVDVKSSLTPKPLYTIFSAPSTAAANLNSGAGETQSNNNALYLASSFDGGSTWSDTPIYVGPSTQTVDHIFPTLSIDSGGVLWAAWSTDSHIFVSHAPTSRARTSALPWSSPVQLDPKGTTANVFAWVAGGGANRADVVWYSGTGSGSGPDDPTAQWVVRYAQLNVSGKGLDISTAVASKRVMHVGQICETGVTCSINGNRDLLDFLQVAITPDGRAAVAWTDDTAAPPAGQIYVDEQCAGVSALTGKNLTTTC